jgi:hypothetical protein
MARKATRKSFFKMTPAEREKDLARYEAGVSFEETRPLDASEQARWERARRGRAGTPNGENDVAVVIRIDPQLLAKAHAAAKRDGKSLSTLISDLLSKSNRRAV